MNPTTLSSVQETFLCHGRPSCETKYQVHDHKPQKLFSHHNLVILVSPNMCQYTCFTRQKRHSGTFASPNFQKLTHVKRCSERKGKVSQDTTCKMLHQKSETLKKEKKDDTTEPQVTPMFRFTKPPNFEQNCTREKQILHIQQSFARDRRARHSSRTKTLLSPLTTSMTDFFCHNC